MSYNPNIHNRRSIRLKGYDYSRAGLYFVTICVKNRKYLFGKIIEGKMVLNDAGQMVDNEWLKIFHRFPNTKLHEYIVMPNHFHAILEIINKTDNKIAGSTLVVDQNSNKIQKGQPQGIAPNKPQQKNKRLGDMTGAFKSITTVEYIRKVKTDNWERFNKKLWQRNYWEHIIRNKAEYNRIANYIINNSANWDKDKLK